MGVLIGFVLGYIFGARAGENSLKDIEEARRSISSSGEIKDVAAGMLSVGRDLMKQGAGALAQRVSEGGETKLRAA